MVDTCKSCGNRINPSLLGGDDCRENWHCLAAPMNTRQRLDWVCPTNELDIYAYNWCEHVRTGPTCKDWIPRKAWYIKLLNKLGLAL